jgi:hypothetical protein
MYSLMKVRDKVLLDLLTPILTYGEGLQLLNHTTLALDVRCRHPTVQKLSIT